MSARRLALIGGRQLCNLCQRDLIPAIRAGEQSWASCNTGAAARASWRQGSLSQQSRGFAAGMSSPKRGPVSYVSLLITAGTGCGLMLAYKLVMTEKMQGGAKPEAVAGKAMVGGPFELMDQDGKVFTDQDLKGNWTLLYFGFTSCPDICPDELDKMTEALDLLEKNGGAPLQPVFVSVDPKRDSVAQVKQYVKEFHPRLIGLTGTKEQTDAAAKAYRVYHVKTGEEKDEDYLVDHSIIMYLLNPEAEFVTFYGKNFDAPTLAKSIKGHLDDWQKSHPGAKMTPVKMPEAKVPVAKVPVVEAPVAEVPVAKTA